MSAKSIDPGTDRGTRDLYRQLLDAWDKRNARDFALLFAPDGSIVGFDGTQVFGQAEIGAHLSQIVTHHQTARYVSIVREVRVLSEGVTILSAVAGMIPPDKDDINPEVNAVQTMVAVRTAAGWKVAHFQNTPAALHGRPDDVRKLSDELRAALKKQGDKSKK
ncbi:MAG TPA: SgcJ/EcaC family oxidoreductase [Gemmatimonadaceae bacterium]